MSKNNTFETGCSKENLKHIRKFATEYFANSRIPDDASEEMTLAIDEACANAMIHANKCDPEKPITISILITDSMVHIKIVDHGKVPFDVNELDDKPIETLVRDRVKGGMGLKLIYSYMDKVEFSSEKGANVCRLTRAI